MPSHTITLTVTPSTKTIALTSGVFVLGDVVNLNVVNSEGNWSGSLNYVLTIKQDEDYSGSAILRQTSWTGGGTNTLSAEVSLNPADITERQRGDDVKCMIDITDTTDTMHGKIINQQFIWRVNRASDTAPTNPSENTYTDDQIDALIAGIETHPVQDSTAIVKGSDDATKLIRLEADTNVPTATTVVLTAPSTDKTLDGVGDERPPSAHASEHTDGTDDIQNSTNAQKGLATAAQITLLESALQNVIDDITPQLGGGLDVNGQSIVSTSAGDIPITPDTTGDLILDGLKWPQADGAAGQFLKTDGAGQLSFGTVVTDLVNDTSPQLGGDLDPNGFCISANHTEELLCFSETASAVNEFTIKNAATGNGPELQATGDDANIDLKLVPKGTGILTVPTDSGINIGVGSDLELTINSDDVEIRNKTQDKNIGLFVRSDTGDHEAVTVLPFVSSGTVQGAKIGINQPTPSAGLNVRNAYNSAGANAGAEIFLETYTSSGASDPSALTMNKSGSNTLGTKSETSSGDLLAIFRAGGVDNFGIGFLQAAKIDFYVDEAPSFISVPGRISFSTTKSGDTTPTERFTVKANGRVGANTTSPAAQFHVDQDSTSAAIPVLTLDQADVSEEFIKLIGTSTTDASQSLVDAADMTTPGSIQGWFKIYIQDDQGTGPITDGIYYVPFYSAPTA